MSLLPQIRPQLRALHAYRAAAQVDDTIRLNANEVPWSDQRDQFRRPLNRYPEVRPAALGEMLAAQYGCQPDNLVVTRGSSEAIDLLIRVFCQPEQDSIMTVAPSFSMYRHYALVQGAELREFETQASNNFALDVEGLLAACDDSVRLLFLCSPNNPTGNSIARADLIRILDALRNQAAVVLDEAYIEFSDAPSAVELLSKYDNLIVLRTLSKALGCAGARCGSVIGAAEVMNIVAAVQAPYALATPVVECVETALEDRGFETAARWARTIKAQRMSLMSAVEAMPCIVKVWPSDANFFLVETVSAATVLAECAAAGLLLRDYSHELPNCIRITVGSESENQRLLEVLRRCPGSG